MKEYINPEFKDLLQQEGMADFQSLWERRDPWFEEPNKGRTNGWSGVCRVEIGGRHFFLKKQENFLVYSISKPLGQSLVEREFDNLKAFEENRIPAMNVIYFGVKKQSGKLQGMIMTEALDEYLAVDEIWNEWKGKGCSLKHKRNVLKAMAALIGLMHSKNLIHKGLYPKHIFIHKGFSQGELTDKPECLLIDLEKARKAKYRSKKQLRDLEKFNRYSGYWSRTDRLSFLLHYLGEKTCNSAVRNFLKNF